MVRAALGARGGSVVLGGAGRKSNAVNGNKRPGADDVGAGAVVAVASAPAPGEGDVGRPPETGGPLRKAVQGTAGGLRLATLSKMEGTFGGGGGGAPVILDSRDINREGVGGSRTR
jgi:hypothetical protein